MMKAYGQILNRFIEMVKSDEEILAVFLFGSAARKAYTKESDIDISLVMNSNVYSTEVLFQKRLKLLQEFDLDIQIFQQLPLYIRIRVIKEGKLLFCRNEDILYNFVFRTIQEFNDFEHIYRDYLKEVAYAG